MESIKEEEENSSDDDQSDKSKEAFPVLFPAATHTRNLRSSNVSRRQHGPSDTTPPKRQAYWEARTADTRTRFPEYRSIGQWPASGLIRPRERSSRNVEFGRTMDSTYWSTAQQRMSQDLIEESSPPTDERPASPDDESMCQEFPDAPESPSDSDQSPAVSPTASPSINQRRPLFMEDDTPASPDLSDDDEALILHDLISVGQRYAHQTQDTSQRLEREGPLAHTGAVPINGQQAAPRIRSMNKPPIIEKYLHKASNLYRRLENLYWWEMEIRMNMLKAKFVDKSMNSALRALRVAKWLPRETFFIGEVVGRGAFGAVYMVETKKGKRYVLKKIPITVGFTRNQLSIFHQLRIERDSLIINHHLNIISIKASWVVPSGPRDFSFFLMMEFAEYGTVDKFIKKTRRESQKVSELLESECMYFNEIDDIGEKHLTELEDHLQTVKSEIVAKERMNPYEANCFRSLVLRLSREFVTALDHMHDHGISHCDLKTDNVLIGNGFHIKIADFGISNINHPIYSESYYQTLDDTAYENKLNFFKVGSLKSAADFRVDLDFTIKFLLALFTGVNVGMSGAIILFARERRKMRKAIPGRFAKHLFFDDLLEEVHSTIEKLSQKGLTENIVDQKLLLETGSLFDLKQYQTLRALDVESYIAELYQQEKRSARKNVTRPDIFETEKWNKTPELENLNVYLDDSVLRTPL